MQEETYELPILDGLEDGSSAGETITVKEDLNTTYKTLKVIHSILNLKMKKTIIHLV
jgi:hypothetical protein